MGLEKLLKNLDKYLNKIENTEAANFDRIDELLEKLERKRLKLEKKIAEEKNNTKKKRLKTDLKIVNLQLRKGHQRREELTEKCK